MGCKSSKNREPSAQEVALAPASPGAVAAQHSNPPDEDVKSPSPAKNKGKSRSPSPKKAKTPSPSKNVQNSQSPTASPATAPENELENQLIERVMQDALKQASEEVKAREEQVADIEKKSLQRRASLAKSLGIKELVWDAELVAESPIAGLSKFLSTNRCRLNDLFKRLDIDRDQALSFLEFQEGMENLGIPLSGDHAAAMEALFAEIDKNGDGKITYNELSVVRNLRRRSSLGSEPGSPTKSQSAKSSPNKSYKSTTATPEASPTKDVPAASPQNIENVQASPKSNVTNKTFAPPKSAAPKDPKRVHVAGAPPKATPSPKQTTIDIDKKPPSPAAQAKLVKKKNKEAASKARSTHLARQQYLDRIKKEKANNKKRRPSQDPGKRLQGHMEAARQSNLTPAGNKRVHPFLDPNGAANTKRIMPYDRHTPEPQTSMTADGVPITTGL